MIILPEMFEKIFRILSPTFFSEIDEFDTKALVLSASKHKTPSSENRVIFEKSVGFPKGVKYNQILF